MRFLLLFLVLSQLTLFSQNNSYHFNGNSYVNIGNQVGDSCRTVEFWFNLDNNINSNLSLFETPIQRNKKLGVNENEFAFVFNPNFVVKPGHLRFKLNDANGVKYEVVSDTNSWSSGVWHHVAAVIDSTDGVMLFIDGQLQQSRDTNYTDPLTSSNDITAIGCKGNEFTQYYKGVLDDIRFSSVARYTSDFIPTCNFTADQYTRGLYNFDTIVSTNSAIDSSQNSFNGTTNNISIKYENACPVCITQFDSITVSKCYSYSSPSGRFNWVQTGIYNDTTYTVNGCDTVITVDLTINNDSTFFMYDTACNSYVSPSGKTYTSGGLFYDTIPNSNGCDSLLTIFLTINRASSSSITLNVCDSLISPNGSVYYTSGNYIDTISNSHGCDSIIEINLTVDTINNSITRVGNTLIANQNNVKYQWLDCSNNYSEITKDTNQTFSTFFSGSYAVELTNTNSCIDTSNCFNLTVVGIEERSVNEALSLSPNPSSGHVYISGNIEIDNIQVYAIDGKIVLTINRPKNVLNFNQFADGLYYLVIDTKKSIYTEKIIIKK